MDIRKKCFIAWSAKHRNRPKEVVESPFPEVFKRCGSCRHDLVVGLVVLGLQLVSMALKAFYNLKDSVILYPSQNVVSEDN